MHSNRLKECSIKRWYQQIWQLFKANRWLRFHLNSFKLFKTLGNQDLLWGKISIKNIWTTFYLQISILGLIRQLQPKLIIIKTFQYDKTHKTQTQEVVLTAIWKHRQLWWEVIMDKPITIWQAMQIQKTKIMPNSITTYNSIKMAQTIRVHW